MPTVIIRDHSLSMLFHNVAAQLWKMWYDSLISLHPALNCILPKLISEVIISKLVKNIPVTYYRNYFTECRILTS